ncbi:MAG TPA: electron transfer flavoprotein subunit alpha/FixB family protein [Bacteroidia bacterium]|nr:electron transfer flavoprotein subunit alpha/FixB family protein [Bacteroidia bacterium]
MSVLVFTESAKGKIRKNSLEAVNYAANIASQLGTKVVAVIDGATDPAALADLGKAGASKVLTITSDKLKADTAAWAAALEQAAAAEGAQVVVFSHDLMGKAIAPRLAVKMKAGIVAGAVDHPTNEGGKMSVRKTVFSGKATAVYTFHSDKKIITLLPNSFQVKMDGAAPEISAFAANLGSIASRITVKEVKTRTTTTVALPEADIVVSAGRGMKDPKNWGIVEDLASALGAATACSRPIADMGWRPHHEHVGQTGITVRPNLYIAIGISGAIQHLAGVNGSKTIVVINSDKEAPFFKAADYGVNGDLFEVVPKLTEAVKKFKASQH